MQTRQIGALEVTTVGIGCNNFGRELDASATRDVIEAALDEGIAFFDTADSYGDPKTASETLLGEIVRPHRDELVLATKFGRLLDDRRRGAGASYVRAATEASLKRLQTDRVDLMQLHIPDPKTPIEDTLGALDELIREGKIREIGCSNFSPLQLRDAAKAAESNNLHGFRSTQAEYSILHAAPVAPLLAECDELGIKLLPFRPLYNGLLTGKYRPGVVPPQSSRIGGKSAEAQARILSTANVDAVSQLTQFAEARGHSILELAFAWLLAHPQVPSVIAGVSSATQVRANAKAGSWMLSQEDMMKIAQIVSKSSEEHG